ncbi:hypothetical protein BD324DRAFT_613276 [Kockovaella imperatae]|uniref:Uncharacterized protein n=1 Tax=Kockovaella imperatae TaxID=4999 RepID=A0A1Y1UUH2_9TREE|nr:hypothetical protein BD324DRAFT_613276 [Kockovaella imperatae]ORX41116.1 hypothetical protein BD324DRAFT_613276 [Kockovaella imperatae]
MGGGNLEVFKFGLYMFFPIVIMFKFGDPDWYKLNVEPLRDIFYPPVTDAKKPPRTHEELQEEMAKMRAETAEKLAQRRQARWGSQVLQSIADERNKEETKWPDWGQPAGRMV